MMHESPDPTSHPTRCILGIDIGGANIKYANNSGDAYAIDFPLWIRSEDLSQQLEFDIAKFPSTTSVVVTMTGELADCYLDRQQGVSDIVDSTCRAVGRFDLPSPKFYSIGAGFLSASQAIQSVDRVAAANWHALATLVAKEFSGLCREGGFLIDIGSTTTDLIAFRDGSVLSPSVTDCDRLRENSLVYLGGGRTAVNTLVDRLDDDGTAIPIMREVFATMDDVRILLGFEPADGSDCRSADNKPRDHFHSANRMARMIGLDHRQVSLEQAQNFAHQVHLAAKQEIDLALASLQKRYEIPDRYPIVLSGHCPDLLPDRMRSNPVIALDQIWPPNTSRSAPAYAIAKLFKS